MTYSAEYSNVMYDAEKHAAAILFFGSDGKIINKCLWYSMVLTCFFIFREILLDFNQFLAIMSTLATFI